MLMEVGEPSRYYDPFADEPTLYLKLANVKIEASAIAGFAHQYGAVWQGREILDSEGVVRRVTPMDEWRSVIKLLRAIDTYRKKGPLPELVDLLNEHLRPVRPDFTMQGLNPEFRFVVDRLFDVVLLQTITSITFGKSIGRCKDPECGTLFERGPKRKNVREYCSNTCKSRHHWRLKNAR